ncbi:hypothetical protein MMJ63_14200 [Bacillus vallismortis]|nr:hypothetical protein [Bacillus vallismortis]
MHNLQLTEQVNKVKKKLTGYWAEDVWNILQCPVYDSSPLNFRVRNIHFKDYSNLNIRNEMKFFLSYRLQDNHYSINSIWNGYTKYIYRLGKFISLKYPHALSIIDINNEKMLLEYRTYLKDNGLSFEKLVKNHIGTKSYMRVTQYINVYNQFYKFFLDYYDERDEIEKDKWDIRKLSVDFNETRGEYIVSFEKIPDPYRTWVKKYVDLRMNVQQNLSYSRFKSIVPSLSKFFSFIKEVYPDWDNLNELSREDILSFIRYLRTLSIVGNSKKPVSSIAKQG